MKISKKFSFLKKILFVAFFLVLLAGLYILIEQYVSIAKKEYDLAQIKQDPYKAYLDLKKRLAKTDVLSQHYAAHIFGADLYIVKGLSGIRVCDGSFSYGCYHGFFLKAVAVNGPDIVFKLDDECGQGNYQTACQHGIGHGLLEFFGSNDRILDALKMCDKLKNINKFGCRAGVFMEYNYQTARSLGRPIARSGNDDNIQLPCSKLPQKYLADCYFYQSQWWISVYKSDFKKIGALCQNLKTSELANECYQGLGNVAAPINNFDTRKSIAKCDEISAETGRFYCKLSLAGTLATGLADNRKDALRICDQFHGEQKNLCVGWTKIKK